MRKIVFIGNCQARRLQVFYDQHFSAVYGDKTETLVSYHPFTDYVAKTLQEADIVVEQLFDTEQTASVSMVDTSAHIIKLPTLQSTFLWPFGLITHVQNKSLPYYGDGPYGLQFGDRWLNKKISKGLPPDEIVQQYLSLDVAEFTDLDRVYELSLERAIEQDRKTGFETASIIASSLAETPLFLTPGNLELPLFIPLARGVYERLGIARIDIDRVLRLQWRSPFPSQQHPVHPSVIKHFGLKYLDEQTRYRMSTGERLTYEEWCHRYVRFEWNDRLLRAVLQTGYDTTEPQELDDQINNLSGALDGCSGSDSGYAILGHLFSRKGDLEKALEIKKKSEAFDPNNPEVAVDLAHFLAESGDIDASEVKLKQVTERWPHVAEAWSRLAYFKDRIGKQDKAYEAIRHAIDLDPANDHYLHFYGHFIRRYPFSHAMMQPFIIAMNIRPHNSKLKEIALEHFLYWEQWQRALAVLDEALRLQPGREDLVAKRQYTAMHLSRQLLTQQPPESAAEQDISHAGAVAAE